MDQSRFPCPLLFVLLGLIGHTAQAQSESLLTGKGRQESLLGTMRGSLDSNQAPLNASLKVRLNNGLTLGSGLGRSSILNSDKNSNYNFDLGYNTRSWGLRSAYRRTERDFAPFGTLENLSAGLFPRNSQDLAVAGWLSLNSQLRISGEASFGEALPGANFDYSSWSTQLEYNFSRNTYGILGYENLDVDFGSGFLVRQRRASLGVRYDLGAGSMLKFIVQYGDLDSARPWGSNTGSQSRGHVISSQISVKF